jgi:hypothetical protein
MDVFTTEEQEKAWNALKRHRKRLFRAFPALLNYIRASYVEIDLKKLNRKAWETYLDFMKT